MHANEVNLSRNFNASWFRPTHTD